MADEFRRPGWYPAPDGAGERWWNGSGWSDSRRGGTVAPAPTSSATTSSMPTPAPTTPAPPRPDPYATPAPTLATAVGSTSRSIDTRLNRNALIGFVVGLVAVFAVNIAGPLAIVFSILGIRRSRQLKAEGNPAGSSTLVLAVIGLAAGVVATLILVGWVAALIASATVSYDPYP